MLPVVEWMLMLTSSLSISLFWLIDAEDSS
jgi:hypothetical protein